ncbi:degt/Dnrj/Eryc1/Strs aminotransferase, partial [Arthrobacter sp. Hiyo6]
RALCDPLGITVLEDSACGAGSTTAAAGGGRADVTAWSFHPARS